MPVDLSQVQVLEERLVNLWPAPTTLLLDGWVVRMANGYSARANSASALAPGLNASTSLMELIESLFKKADLPPAFRISPLADAALQDILIARGYHVKDRAITMTAPLAGFADKPQPQHIRIEPHPVPDWLNGVSALQVPSKRSAAHLEAIVGQIKLPAAFATITTDAGPVGFGMAAMDRGIVELGSIILAPEHRGMGHGRALMEALLHWATAAGGSAAFLQVTDDNLPAQKLYASLGFREIYAYTTLVLSNP